MPVTHQEKETPLNSSRQAANRSTKRGERTKLRVLDATIRIASTEGHRAATVARITKETGVSASSIYWHFKDKQTLVAAALEHSYRESRPLFSFWNPERKKGTRLKRLIQNLTRGQTLDLKTAYWRLGVTVALEGGQDSTDLQNRFKEIRQESRQRLRLWWRSELSDTKLANSELQNRLTLLTDLTLAFLDGRYIAAALGFPLSSSASTGFAHGLEFLAGPDSLPNLEHQNFESTPPTAPATSRETLLQAATTVMSRHGFHASTIADICKEANLPASSLYWKFKDKEDLLASVIGEGILDYPDFENLNSEIHDDNHPGLTDTLSRHLHRLQVTPGPTKLGLLLALHEGPTGVKGRDLYIDVRQNSVGTLSKALASTPLFQHQESDAITDISLIMMALFDGLFIGQQIEKYSIDLYQFSGAIVPLLKGTSIPA